MLQKLLTNDPTFSYNLNNILNKLRLCLNIGKSSFVHCSGYGCTNSVIETHNVKKLNLKNA
jgi:hypothetical protein